MSNLAPPSTRPSSYSNFPHFWSIRSQSACQVCFKIGDKLPMVVEAKTHTRQRPPPITTDPLTDPLKIAKGKGCVRIS